MIVALISNYNLFDVSRWVITSPFNESYYCYSYVAGICVSNMTTKYANLFLFIIV